LPKISEELREERREAIIGATLRCLARAGYAGTSMRTIAEAAGLTKGGLYAYFGSKEEILLTLADRYMETQLAGFRPRPGETGRESLERVLRRYAETAASEELGDAQRAILDLWVFAGEIPAVRNALRNRYERYVGALTALVEGGQRDGSLRRDVEPGEVAGLILAARDGMVFYREKLRLPVPADQWTVLLGASLVQYLET
jgi:AcrR family transcriptional regulator